MSRRTQRGPRWLGDTVPVVPTVAAQAANLSSLPRAAIGMRARPAGRRSALAPAGSLLTHALLLAALIWMARAPARVPPLPDPAIAMLFEQPPPAPAAVEPPPLAPAAPSSPPQQSLPAKAEDVPSAKPPPPRPKPSRPVATPAKPAASPAAPAPPSPAPAPATAAPASAAPVAAAPPPTAPRVLGAISSSCPGAYTEQARRRALQGRVVIRARIAADGTPAEVSVASSSGSPQLDRIALDAVRVCRGFPKGEAFLADIPYLFRLIE